MTSRIEVKIRSISDYSKKLIEVRDNNEIDLKKAFLEVEETFVEKVIDSILLKLVDLESNNKYQPTIDICTSDWKEFYDYCKYINDDACNSVRNDYIRRSLAKYGIPEKTIFNIEGDFYGPFCMIRFFTEKLAEIIK